MTGISRYLATWLPKPLQAGYLCHLPRSEGSMDVVHHIVLQKLAEGGRFNVLHSTARQLIAQGLAREEWGKLVITEAGRIALRPRSSFTVVSEHVTDLNFGCQLSDDPMSNPQAEPFELLEEAPPEPLPPPTDRMQQALRAAGVASGKTGVWVDDKWVAAFIAELDGA
jgi:hypothetical protein